MKEKKDRRSKVKTASLEKRFNTRIRQEYTDLDYVDELDDTKANCKLPDGTMVTELEYMAIFMKEWNSGNVPKQKEAKKGKLHRTVKDIKNCTDRTNQRNRCEYGQAKARNLVHKMDELKLNELVEKKSVVTSNYVEDAMIDVLDGTKELGKSTDNSDE